jgi:hypothetical protein
MYYFVGGALIYLALSVVFIADVLRNRRLTSGERIGWIAALILAPIFAWPIYGIVRMRQKRGLA